MNTSITTGLINGAFAGALWGIIFLAPAILGDFSPLQLSFGRYVAYGVVSVVLLGPRLVAVAKGLDRNAWLGLAGLALSGNLVYFFLVAKAVQVAGGAATSLIVGMVPLVVAVASLRDRGALPLRRLAPGLLLSMVGVALIAWQALSTEALAAPWSGRLVGLLCAVGALLSWSAYSVSNRRMLALRPGMGSHDWSLLTGVVTGGLALLLTPLALGTPGHDTDRWMLFAGVSTLVAIFASVLGNAFWNRASRQLPLSLSGQMIVFETLFALLYSFAWQKRWPELLEYLAIVFLLGGVVFGARAHAPRGTASPTADADDCADSASVHR